MAKIRRFIDCYVPVTTCNLRCHYCYITLGGLWGARLPQFRYTPEHIGKALSPERLGGICHLNLCGGGETLLPREMPMVIRALLEQGHFVMVITNGTFKKRFEEIASLPRDLLDRLGFKLSFHYLELRRKRWMDLFFDNACRIRDAGCSISVEVTPNDELIPYINDVMEISERRVGAKCHATVTRDEADPKKSMFTKLGKAEYRRVWGGFASDLFDFKLSTFGVRRHEYCYAGDWSAWLDLGSGELTACYSTRASQNIFEDISRPIQFRAIGKQCPEPHCFNSHAFLTLGAIPELNTPSYAEMRNRRCADGTEWLTPNMREFLSGKLRDTNKEYAASQKVRAAIGHNVDEIAAAGRNLVRKLRRRLNVAE